MMTTDITFMLENGHKIARRDVAALPAVGDLVHVLGQVVPWYQVKRRRFTYAPQCPNGVMIVIVLKEPEPGSVDELSEEPSD